MFMLILIIVGILMAVSILNTVIKLLDDAKKQQDQGKSGLPILLAIIAVPIFIWIIL